MFRSNKMTEQDHEIEFASAIVGDSSITNDERYILK